MLSSRCASGRVVGIRSIGRASSRPANGQISTASAEQAGSEDSVNHRWALRVPTHCRGCMRTVSAVVVAAGAFWLATRAGDFTATALQQAQPEKAHTLEVGTPVERELA